MMKRRITLVATLCLGLAACGSEAPVSASSGAEKAWITPPTIETAMIEGGSLTLTGTASPSGRVVLATPTGQVFAAAADETGRFRLVTPRPVADTLFTAEVQTGQARYPAPGRLLVSGTAGGPIAFVSAGAPTRRFDPAPGLDAVDSDGRAVFLSGRAAASTTVTITAGVQRPVAVGEDGRWSVAPAGLPDVIQIDGRAFEPQIDLGGPDGLVATTGGWRLVWTAAGGARQVAWFPGRNDETSR
jgi:hypothetical protein